jgi:hypothetical protein
MLEFTHYGKHDVEALKNGLTERHIGSYTVFVKRDYNLAMNGKHEGNH